MKCLMNRVLKKVISFLIPLSLLSMPCYADDLSNWMGKQAQTIPGFTHLSITQIAMPGTHDALTFNIHEEKRAQGALGLAVKVPLVGKGIVNLSKAQGDDLIGQFQNGSRYFDLRVALTNKGFEGVHGLYNGPISESFKEFKEYLEKHPSEFVILDFQNIDAPNKQELVNVMREIFGGMIYPASKQTVNVSYATLMSSGQRVIILMKDAAKNDNTSTVFDRRRFLRSKWHNEQDPKTLAAKIIVTEQKIERDFNKINVIQAQTTPDTKAGIKSVLKSVFTLGHKGGLEQDAKKSLGYQKAILKKATEAPDLMNSVNVFMVDHLSSNQAKNIIALNQHKSKLIHQ